MAWEKFGRARNKPAGTWVQTTHLESVAGTSYRKPEVRAFCAVVKAAEKAGLRYGLRVRPDVYNQHDPNAIAVYGFAEQKSVFGKLSEQEWHVGYVPAPIAAEIQRDLLLKGVPIEAELYGIEQGDEAAEIRFFVLAPSGYGVKARTKAATA